jgi:hypothetical protein
MLLAVYLRFSETYYFKQNKEMINLIIEFRELEDLLNIKTAKSPKIDLLLLLVWHLKEFIDQDLVLNSIKAGEGFDKVMEQLSSQQKNILAANFLSYGASISEYELFIHDRI